MSAARRWPSTFLAVLLIAAAPGGWRFLDLWLTADQQGRYYFDRGDHAQAAERFQDPMWKGVAHYSAGDFASAIDQFARLESAEADFNLGNAYARSGQYEEAVASYDQALSRRPGYADAQENRDLVQAILDRQALQQPDGGPGTGGMLEADEFRIDETGERTEGAQETQVLTGQELSDELLAELWMRRIQTTPADFLRQKFAYQLLAQEQAETQEADGP